MGVDYILLVCITILLSLGLPLTAALVVITKRVSATRVVLTGAAAYVVFQVFLRGNLLNPLLSQLLPQLIPQGNTVDIKYILYILVFSLSAGKFEELGRYLAFIIVLKQFRRWRDGIGYGIGHGGVESVLLLGIGSITWLFGYTLVPGQPLWMVMMGGIERVLAMILHIGFTMLVLYGVNKKRFGYVLLAIGWHTLSNFAVLMTGIFTAAWTGVWGGMTVTAIFAAAALVWIVKSRKLLNEAL